MDKRWRDEDVPPVLTAAALKPWTSENEMAKTHIIHDPFWMPFILINQHILGKLLKSDARTFARFIVRAQEHVSSIERRGDDRDSLAADIKSHPLIWGDLEMSLLRCLFPTARSIDTISGGLPTLGKRR